MPRPANLVVKISGKSDGPMGPSTDPAFEFECLQNRRRFLGPDLHRRLVISGSVFGTEVAFVESIPESHVIPRVDALITAKPIVLGVRTQDCIPCVVAAPKSGNSPALIGTAHLAWECIVKGLPRILMDALVKQGARLETVSVELLHGIHQCCFIVKDDARGLKNFSRWPAFVKPAGMGKWRIDLYGIARELFRAAGVPDENIEDSKTLCTACARNRRDLSSWRRDRKLGHNMLTVAYLE